MRVESALCCLGKGMPLLQSACTMSTVRALWMVCSCACECGLEWTALQDCAMYRMRFAAGTWGGWPGRGSKQGWSTGREHRLSMCSNPWVRLYLCIICVLKHTDVGLRSGQLWTVECSSRLCSK
jgi:hypothetical protein